MDSFCSRLVYFISKSFHYRIWTLLHYHGKKKSCSYDIYMIIVHRNSPTVIISIKHKTLLWMWIISQFKARTESCSELIRYSVLYCQSPSFLLESVFLSLQFNKNQKDKTRKSRSKNRSERIRNNEHLFLFITISNTWVLPLCVIRIRMKSVSRLVFPITLFIISATHNTGGAGVKEWKKR